MRLPELTARPQRAERPSQQAVRPTDLGLAGVAQDMGEWAQEVERTKAIEEELGQVEAEEAVRPILEGLGTRIETEFAESGANWDPTQPGYARAATTRLNQTLAGFGDDLPLTPTERDAVERGKARLRQSVGQRAVAYESQTRGQVAAEAASAREAVETGGMMARFTKTFADRRQVVDLAYDGSQADYSGQLVALHDQTAAEIIEQTPENLKSRVTSSLAAQRLSLMGQSMEVQQRGEQAYVIGQARSSVDMLINAVLSNPASADDALAQIDGLVAPLAAGPRAELRARATEGVQESRVSALIRDGQEDVAIDLLNGGSMDSQLRPEIKERLLGEALRKRDEPSAEDFIGQLRTQDLMQDNLASIATSGVDIDGADPASLVDQLTPAQLAQYTLDIEKARQQRAATPTFTQMTQAQISAHVESLKPVEGTPGFADAQRAYEMAGASARRELEAREEDPAAWAMNAVPSLRANLEALSSGNPDVARRNAVALATGILTLQDQAGIPMGQRRIFTKGIATAMVERAEGNADPVAGLAGLAQVVNAFQAPTGAPDDDRVRASARRQKVVAELIQAGAEPSDLAAAVLLNGRGAAMGAYVAGDRSGLLNTMERPQRERLQGLVDTQLRPYFASLDGAPNPDGLTPGRRSMAYKLAAGRITARPGTSVEDAARWAADQVAAPYTFVGPTSLRVPERIASRPARDIEAGGGGSRDGAGDIQRGTARLMRMITDRDGAGWWDPQTNPSMDPSQRRRLYGDQVRQTGRWVARGDDSGAAYVYRNNEGQWVTARNAQGRPISASWDALASGRLDPEAGQAASARPRQAAQAAAPAPVTVWGSAVRWVETRDNPARTSERGAAGAMQLIPGTARQMAQRLGIPYDPRRVLTDVAYNTRLGHEYLNVLQRQYGGDQFLATTAYHAGPGLVDAWLKPIGTITHVMLNGRRRAVRGHGDPRSGAITRSGWLARIAPGNPRSAAYPRAVFARMGMPIDGARR